MVNQELINFIKSQLERGVNRSEIEDQLLKNGWLKADIDSAFNLATASIEPTVSEPVFEIKQDLTNQQPTSQTQQPAFQFSQELKEQPAGSVQDLGSQPSFTPEISQEDQRPQPIQPFKVQSFENLQPLKEEQPVENNLANQDQDIFEPPLKQNQYEPQNLKEETFQNPLQPQEFQQPEGFSALDFSQVSQTQSSVQPLVKLRNMSDIVKIVVSFILGAGITFLILFALNDYSLPIGVKETTQSQPAEIIVSMTPSPSPISLNSIPYRNDNLGILRMDYPIGFTPIELFISVSDLPFTLPADATTNIVFNSDAYGMEVFLSISVAPLSIASATTTATTTPLSLNTASSSQILQEIIDNVKIQSSSAIVQGEEERLIGKYEAKLIEFLESNGMHFYDLITIIPEKSQVYYFKFIASQNYWEDFRPLFEQIISQIELQ